MEELIKKSAKVIIDSFQKGGKLLIAGNGGSAADGQHFAAELVGKFKKERKALPAIALTVNTSTLTAIGNDYSFDKIFSRQIDALAKKGDVFFAISTSGNSANIIEAINKAKEIGCYVIGLTGRTGGKIKDVCDILITVNSEDTPRIQEKHIFIIHSISEIIENFYE